MSIMAVAAGQEVSIRTEAATTDRVPMRTPELGSLALVAVEAGFGLTLGIGCRIAEGIVDSVAVVAGQLLEFVRAACPMRTDLVGMTMQAGLVAVRRGFFLAEWPVRQRTSPVVCDRQVVPTRSVTGRAAPAAISEKYGVV